MTEFNFQYIPGHSLFHQMDGRTKIALLVSWGISVFMFFDLRILLLYLLIGFGMIGLSGIPFYRIRKMLLVMISFVVVTGILTNIVSPTYAGRFIEVQHPLFTIGSFTLTKETAFYSVMLMVKYLAIFPVAILFLLTTHPSRFASSLHRLGMPYKIAYSLNIALRYLPNVQREFVQIAHAQQARGLSLHKGGASLWKRMKGWLAIMLPLITSSLDRVETITNAMDLRGFGRGKSRTWYNATTFQSVDYFVLGFSLFLIISAIFLKIFIFPSFWYPFS